VKVSRRSFFGILPGAALGARAAAAESLALGEGTLAALPGVMQMMPVGIDKANAIKELARLALPSARDRMMADAWVSRLDPDLASMHSMSLAVRFQMQRERQVDREMAKRKTWLEGIVAGLWE
jgi:acetyl-CoA acetyltransferase